MKNFIHKNKIYIGVIFGILLPMIADLLIHYIHSELNGPTELDPYKETLLFERISIFANLIGFYYFLNKGHYQTVRGIVIMTFILALAYAMIFFAK